MEMVGLTFEWDEEKRYKNINERGLDIAALGPLVLADPNVVIRQDERQDYGEERWQAYGNVDGLCLCVCFTLRGNVIRLITIFKLNKTDWEKHYEGKNH